jgi:hypothetical protein
MEIVTFIDNIVGYRGGFYEFISAEAQDATYILVIVVNGIGQMAICLNTGETEVNGVVPQTQEELLAIFNNV